MRTTETSSDDAGGIQSKVYRLPNYDDPNRVVYVARYEADGQVADYQLAPVLPGVTIELPDPYAHLVESGDYPI